MKDYLDREIKEGNKVRSIYVKHEPENIGTVKKIEGEWRITYDDEPDNDYKILDSRYLIKLEE